MSTPATRHWYEFALSLMFYLKTEHKYSHAKIGKILGISPQGVSFLLGQYKGINDS